jgi:hypothetical protein
MMDYRPGQSYCTAHGYRRFFIVGCQRTGTTLLRLILECHPQVFCYDEGLAYRVLMHGEDPSSPNTHLVGFKIPRWTEQLANHYLRDAGLPENAVSFYHNEPILFLFRDVRDTIASMLKLRMTERKTWLELCADPILRTKARSASFQRRYAVELALIEKARSPLLLKAALYWKYKTEAYFDYQERGWPIHPVVYEDLVTTPEAALRKVVSFLNLPWHPNLLDHPRFQHAETYPDGTVMGNSDPKRPIDDTSVCQWRHFLSSKEEAEVLDLVGDLPLRIERLRGSMARSTEQQTCAGLRQDPVGQSLFKTGGDLP